MTEGFVTPDPIAWEHAVAEVKAANAANAQELSLPGSLTAGFTLSRVFEAEDALMAMHAPDIQGVIEKLLVIWADELEVVTPDSYPLMGVIGDLRRLAAAG